MEPVTVIFSGLECSIYILLQLERIEYFIWSLFAQNSPKIDF